MQLGEFIKQFVLPNTLIRLWYPTDQVCHKRVMDDVMMEWELAKSEFARLEVVGVTDILCLDSPYKEAVNIVVQEEPKI